MPQGGILTVAVLSAHAQHVGQRCVAGEYGEPRRLAWVVESYPGHASHGVGKPRAALDDGGVGTPRHTHGADVVHGRVAQRLVERYLVGAHPGVGARAHYGVGHVGGRVGLFGLVFHLEAPAEVEGRAFVVRPQQTRHIGHAHFLRWPDAHGQLRYRVGESGLRRKLLHYVELAHAVVFGFIEIIAAAVGFPEREFLLAVPEAQIQGYFLHVGRGKVICRVGGVDASYAAYIGRYGYVVVGDALRGPHSAYRVWPLALHFENPHFFRVGYGEAFARVAVAVFLYQASHELYGLAGRGATLQGHALKLLDHKHALVVAQGVAAAVGGLAHGKLALVQAGIGSVEEAERVPCLRNLARALRSVKAFGVFGMHASAIHAHHRVAWIIGRRHLAHPGAVP